jgi:hypothetical protein
MIFPEITMGAVREDFKNFSWMIPKKLTKN